jgi:phosphatidylserine/phosphatidylglycerophosphate/cardiolipin synthase-like enzyme
MLDAITAGALQPAPPVAPFAAAGTVQYAFTPEDHADGMIIAAIDMAQRQVLVQAYGFSHRRIADALVRAQYRGVEVAVLVDQEQSGAALALMRNVARSGALVMIDPRHAAAHSKIMVIDHGTADCAVVTGSFNFTYAAQHHNAENMLILRGNPPLCEAYFNNWRRHHTHARATPR